MHFFHNFSPHCGNNYLLAYVDSSSAFLSQYVRKSKHQQNWSFKQLPISYFLLLYLMIRGSEATAVVLLQRNSKISNICVTLLHLFTIYIVWSVGFLYKVAPPELKNSPIMYFVIHNSVVLSKILKIIVPFWPLFAYVDYYQNNQFYRVKNRIFKILLLWHNNFQYFG